MKFATVVIAVAWHAAWALQVPPLTDRRQALRRARAGVAAAFLVGPPVAANAVSFLKDERNDEFLRTYPKALAFEAAIALVIYALSVAGIGPLAEKFKRDDK
mmetsp:Transcript_25607/g.78774  ORF Transcript_25607/g.78774 Transcript_25607/m.78774 type:complete len:102 (+) Transcript_25607:21-326(+)